MDLRNDRLFQWGKTPKPPHNREDQPFGHPADGDDLDAEFDRLYERIQVTGQIEEGIEGGTVRGGSYLTTSALEGGMVLATLYTRKRMKADGTLSLSSTFPHCGLAAAGDTPYCIYNGTVQHSDDHWAAIDGDMKYANGNALGEGWILATDRNGEIGKGDMIGLGELPGYAHRLDPATPLTMYGLS